MGGADRHPLVLALGPADAFVCDTAPLVHRLERSGPPRTLRAVDALFEAVEANELTCLVPSVCAAELLVRPYRLGPPAVTVADGFLRSPAMEIVPPGLGTAHGAARALSAGRLRRLADAVVAAVAAEAGVPLVTSDRRLARATGALLVADHV